MTDVQAISHQRGWARVAGLMYWLVLVADMTGWLIHSRSVGRGLTLLGSVLTVPLALGLFYAVRPVQRALAGTALVFRLLEAALGAVSTVCAFAAVRATLRATGWGRSVLGLAQWDDATGFAAFVFTIGSTLFFLLFWRARSIPRVLAGWGFVASVLAMGACVTHLIRPTFPEMTMSLWIPMLLGETTTGLWLLIRSVRVPGAIRGERERAEGTAQG